MRPQTQLIAHDPSKGDYGDCHRTCIAAILDMDAADVPHFCDGPDLGDGAHTEAARIWLMGLGFGYFSFPSGNDLDYLKAQMKLSCRDTPIILGGRSGLGCNHSVVMMNGEIVCDPSGNGIVGPCDDGLYWIEVIGVGPNWGGLARG